MNMTIHHAGQPIVIRLARRRPEYVVATAWLEGQARGMAAISSTALDALTDVLEPLSAALRDCGHVPLSDSERARIFEFAA
jgi:hypothetical protein